MSAERQYALRYSALCVKDVEGWLVKEGRSLRARRSRYVRLRGSVLSSHRSKNAPASWEIAVTNATVARGPAHEWHILLDLPNKHVSFLATGKKEFEEWIYALRRASLFSSRVEDYYRVRHIVGEGMNGKVRLGNDLITDETVAIKTVPRLGRANEDDFLAREVQIMLSMDHPNIVRTFDIFVRRKRIHFVMEYVPGGELFDLVAANTIFTEPRAVSVMLDLLRAISYLHARGIAHRDVKLENLLCMRNTWPLQVKLADFGFANHIRSDSDKLLSSFVGTPYYIAPEMLRGKGHGRPVDIWACGVVMYILLSGKFPFGGETEKEYYSRVVSREAYFPSQEWNSVSSDAKELVAGMLHKDPAKRLNAEQCLSHPWLQQATTTDVDPVATASTTPTSAPPVPQETEKDRPGLLSPERFRRNRSKAGKSRNQALLNNNLHNILTPNNHRRHKKDPDLSHPVATTPVTPQSPPQPAPPAPHPPKMQTSSSRQKISASTSRHALLPDGGAADGGLQRAYKPPARAAVDQVGQRESNVARPGALRASGNLANGARRQSLIRRLLSSSRVSLDRYENRYPSFTGAGEDGEDEMSALPRKTISLFGKLAPIRRSFHRGRPEDGPGGNFVNSQTQPGAQRLPPKLAREQLRQAAQERKASRRALFRFRRGSVAGSSLSGSVASSSGPPSRQGTPGPHHASANHSRVVSDASHTRNVSDHSAAAVPVRAASDASHAAAPPAAPAKRIVSDASVDRVVSDHSIAAPRDDKDKPAHRPVSWPESPGSASFPRRSRFADPPRRQQSGSDGRVGAECVVPEAANTPLSQQQMSLILGYEEEESNGSLQPSSGSTFGYQWSANCAPTETQKRGLLLSAQMMTR